MALIVSDFRRAQLGQRGRRSVVPDECSAPRILAYQQRSTFEAGLNCATTWPQAPLTRNCDDELLIKAVRWRLIFRLVVNYASAVFYTALARS